MLLSWEQGDIYCFEPASQAGKKWRFEREFEEIREEIIQNQVSLGGSPTINVTLIGSMSIVSNVHICTFCAILVLSLMRATRSKLKVAINKHQKASSSCSNSF